MTFAGCIITECVCVSQLILPGHSKVVHICYICTQKDKERSMSSVDSVGVVFQKYEATKVSACWCLFIS